MLNVYFHRFIVGDSVISPFPSLYPTKDIKFNKRNENRLPCPDFQICSTWVIVVYLFLYTEIWTKLTVIILWSVLSFIFSIKLWLVLMVYMGLQHSSQEVYRRYTACNVCRNRKIYIFYSRKDDVRNCVIVRKIVKRQNLSLSCYCYAKTYSFCWFVGCSLYCRLFGLCYIYCVWTIIFQCASIHKRIFCFFILFIFYVEEKKNCFS